MTSIFTRLLLTAALATAALAGDINGKWKSSFTTPDGQTRESTWTFKAEGGKLTGNTESTRGKTDISEGKIDGDNFSFVVVRNFNGNEMKIGYSGKVAGDELKMSMKMGDRDMEMTAKRVK